MRLFVCVRPPDDVLDRLDEVVARCRPGASGGVRWADRSTWHVTLHFLGEVADPDPVVEALAGMALPAVEADLGPAVELLGRRVVCAPIAGLEGLARTVQGAVAHLGESREDRPFRGHVTLARLGRSGGGYPCVGQPIAARWTVDDIALVRSHLGQGPARYEDLFVRAVGAADA
jgi:RNA 2',3'-cyclic 3'-phosphodiesterase